MKPASSRALEVNIAEYRVDVSVDPKYNAILEVMSRYDGLQKVLDTFLKELSHPYKNWQFITGEARTYSLGYFYDLIHHPKGPDAVKLYVDMAVEAIENARGPEVKIDAFHYLYLLLQKFIKEGGPELAGFLGVISYGFDRVRQLSDEDFSLIIRDYYQFNRLAGEFLRYSPPETDMQSVNSLVIHCLEYTFSYWLSESDPLSWFEHELGHGLHEEISGTFGPLSHTRINTCQERLHKIKESGDINSRETLEALLELPGYGEITGLYKDMPDRLFEKIEDDKMRHQYRLIFLFHIMGISGLSNIHEETLTDINRNIAWLIEREDIEHVQQLIRKTFDILKRSVDDFPEAVLKSVINMGKGVYRTDESDLVHFFNSEVVRLGFQTPDFAGISDDWQIQSNQSHILNIRIWMELVKLNPKWSKKLISSLIIHLSLSGILIKDTDLFPRDISDFLNSDIQPVFNLAKQLMRLFPAYFNEIGAEGQLRDISTTLDEIHRRKDVLIHFLRKQSHVESSNKIISLIEAILEFWKTGTREVLKPYLPNNIYEQIDPEGPFVVGMSKVINHIFADRGLKKTSDLLSLEDDYMERITGDLPEENRQDVERMSLAISFYKMLNQKYCVSFCELHNYITQVKSTIPLDLARLEETLAVSDTYKKISGLLDMLQELKGVVLSHKRFEVREDIYRKRHIAADIPSMYGSYREAKFDALGLTFRVESLVNTLFEELIEEFDFDFITHDTFYRIYKYLKLFHQALNIDGIPAKELEVQLDLFRKSLNIKLFTLTQYLDVFRGFSQAVRNIVSDYFNNIHKDNLQEIVNNVPVDKLLPKYFRVSGERQELFHKVSEIFLRDTIASSLGVQRLDLFLTRISNTLHRQAEKLAPDKHYLLLTYDPGKIVTSIISPDSKILDIVHLGYKGINMIKMTNLGLPVPPGFIITTEIFRCRELIEKYHPATVNFKRQIGHHIALLEKRTGRKFGSPDNPLLVSVRSGAAVSQPGMMDSYLNVGINESIVQGIIKRTGREWFAWDSYRRFLQSFGMSFGLNRDRFDAIIEEFKKKYSVNFKKDLTAGQMKEVAGAYKAFIRSNGIEVEESPKGQLFTAVEQVLNSWNSVRAHAYRKIMGVSDDWGTAVTVQVMVFGNLSLNSGSGVLFTHSPKFSPDLLRPWGDYSIGNQGEDVVSGLVTTYPISNYQAKMENRPADFTLESKFPEIYQTLRDIAKVMIYENQWEPQDIEFTFEGPRKVDLYLLQTRNMEMRERKTFPYFESADDMAAKFLGHGIGVSGGALSGRIVFNLDDITYWKKAEPKTPLILIRNDTVPDDIKEISAADGLLTARGGATSHAAIVADRLEKTCVVGCRDLICKEKERKFILNEKEVMAGDFISIDGSEGSIYFGKMDVIERRD